MYGPRATDVESGQYASFDSPLSLGISPTSVRMGFVRKVYSILSIQLLATTLIASPFVLMDTIRVQSFIYQNQWLFYFSLAVSLLTMIVFACFPGLMRQVPINYLLLSLFTLTEGLTVGIVSSMYTTGSVVMALALVCLVTCSLTVYATNTTKDFTKSAYPYLLAVTVVMMGAGLVLIFFPTYLGSMVYAAVGAVLFLEARTSSSSPWTITSQLQSRSTSTLSRFSFTSSNSSGIVGSRGVATSIVDTSPIVIFFM